jgi:hypothetical protein
MLGAHFPEGGPAAHQHESVLRGRASNIAAFTTPGAGTANVVINRTSPSASGVSVADPAGAGLRTIIARDVISLSHHVIALSLREP